MDTADASYVRFINNLLTCLPIEGFEVFQWEDHIVDILRLNQKNLITQIKTL